MARGNSWLPERWDYEADVVIIGYGGAGACAAIAGHDAGVKVILLEKAPMGGGNTSVSGGGSAIPTDVKKGMEYYRALTAGLADEKLISTLAKSVHRLPTWIESLGGKLEFFPNEPLYPSLPGSDGFRQLMRMARTPKQVKEGLWWTFGDDLFGFFDSQVKKRKIKIIFNTAGKGLIQDPMTREILGVKAISDNGEIFIKAKRGVTLACGGFENNKEMVQNYLPHATELPIYPFGTPYNTGEGVTMAAEVGAKLWHMVDLEFGNFAPKAPSEKFGVGFRMIRQLPPGSPAIYVNKYGQRFMSESITLSHRKELFEVQRFDQKRAEYPNIPFYMVFDETSRKKCPIVETRYGWWAIHKMYKWSDDNSAEVKAGWILKANTVKALAGKINVPAQALEETVAKFNKYCTSGKDRDFGRDKEWLAPLVTPPFYATELCEPIINTQGGPKHNELAQVLDNNDKPIPRLYAAGELGSVFFPLYQTCSNLPEAFAFGKIAGEQAAALKPWK